jgi:hypothetical protein
VPAKLDFNDGQPKLIAMVEAFQTTTKTMPVTTMRVEKKTRKVVGADGKETEQEYNVVIPMTVHREVEVPTSSAGRKPTVHDATDFRFFDAAGKTLPIDEVKIRLKTLRPIFLLDRCISKSWFRTV